MKLTGTTTVFQAYKEYELRFPLLGLIVGVFLCLIAFIVIEKFYFRFTLMTAAEYASPSLLVAMAEKAGVLGLALAAVATLVAASSGRLLVPWGDFESGFELRIFIVFLALVVAWPLATLGFNYYFNQGYYLERLLLVSSIALLWYRPVFIYAFLLLAFVLLLQLAVPRLNSGSHLPHKLQLLHVLCMFAAFLLVALLINNRNTNTLFLLVCCIIASAYWIPALTKIQLNWINHGQIYHMPLAAYAHGWLANLSPEVPINLSRMLTWFDWPMRVFVLLIEAGCLLFLFRRSISLLLLAGVMVFHLGVFLLYGYLFWTWILLDLALFVILLRDRERQRIAIYTPAHLVLSVLLIYFSRSWSNPSTLGWYDTPLTYTYHYQAVGGSGREYTIPPRFFSPYGDVFTMANFSYLVAEHPFLVSPYGITGNLHSALGLRDAHTAGDVFALESHVGRQRYRQSGAEQFFVFVQQYLSNRNAADRDSFAVKYLQPPPQFWSTARGALYTGQEPLREVTVREVTTFFDGQELKQIRDLVILTIPIPGTASNE